MEKEDTILDFSYGIIPVYKKEGEEFLFCIVEHEGEHFTFPKGHMDMGESEIDTAMRELKEETGITEIKIVPNISFSQKYTFKKDKKVYDKTVKYFLGFVDSMESFVTDGFEHEISKIKWVNFEDLKKSLLKGNEEMLNQIFEYLKNT